MSSNMHPKFLAASVALNAIAIIFLALSQRYGMEALPNGILRIDRLTGSITICKSVGKGRFEC